MNTRTTWVLIVGLIVLVGGAYWYSNSKESASTNAGQSAQTEVPGTSGE